MALTDNLVAAWDFSGGSGSTIADVINAIVLALAGGADFSGGGLTCNASGERASVTAPGTLKITGGALSFGVNVDVLATPDNYAPLIGCGYNAAFSNPYWGYGLIKNDSGFWAIDFNDGGTYTQLASTTAPTTGLQNFLVVVSNSARRIYRNGTLIAEATTTVAAPTYDTDAIFGVGNVPGAGNSQARLMQGYVWAGDRSADASAFNADPDGTDWAFAAGDPPPSNRIEFRAAA